MTAWSTKLSSMEMKIIQLVPVVESDELKSFIGSVDKNRRLKT